MVIRKVIATFGAVVLALLTPLPLLADETSGPATSGEGSATAPAIAAFVEDLKAALHEVSGGTSVSGFFDVNAVARRTRLEEVAFGCFELGLARSVGTRAEVVAAVVMNGEGAEMTVGLLDIRLSPASDEGQPDAMRLQAGRFDVPFGADWQSYASKDRVEVSAPLTTETLLDGGLNAAGINLTGVTRHVDYSVFAFRDGDLKRSGGRVALASHAVSAGISFMHVTAAEDGANQRLLGVDLDARIGRIHLRAERIERQPQRASRLTGWHTTIDADVLTNRHATLTPFIRYDSVSPGDAASRAARAGQRTRLTGGLNTRIAQVFIFKLEYQRRLAGDRWQSPDAGHSWLAQLVVAF